MVGADRTWRAKLDGPARLIFPASRKWCPPANDLKASGWYHVFGFDLTQHDIVMSPLIATCMSTGKQTFHVCHLEMKTCGTVWTSILNENTSVHRKDINGKLGIFLFTVHFQIGTKHKHNSTRIKCDLGRRDLVTGIQYHGTLVRSRDPESSRCKQKWKHNVSRVGFQNSFRARHDVQ